MEAAPLQPEGGPAPAEPPRRPPGRVKVFACPSCGASVTLRAVGQTVTAQCSHCSSLIDVANESYRVIAEAHERAREARIGLGRRGRLLGIDWEAIGFQERSDGSGEFHWTEYLLFNPYYGYRFLIEEDGTWTIARMLTREVPGIGSEAAVDFEGRRYEPFSRGTAKTDYVGGEFYWRARAGDTSSTADYVAPPYRLFLEETEDEVVVSHGQHLDAATVEAAFRLEPGRLLAAGSVGAGTPNPYRAAAKSAWRFALLGMAAATLVQIVDLAMADNARVATLDFGFSAADRDKSVTLRQFTLPKDGNVEFHTASRLNNDWLELDLSLVNVASGESFDVTQGMEAYSGYDSDGYWAEGDPISIVVLPHVPAGDYKLVASPDAGSFAKPAATSTGVDFQAIMNLGRSQGATTPTPTPAPPPAPAPTVSGTILVTRDVMNWSNYGLALLLLLTFPLVVTALGVRFEMKRWSGGGGSGEE